MNLHEPMAGVAVTADVADAISVPLERKCNTPELGFGPRVPVIDGWALAELQRLAPDRLDLPQHDTEATAAEADALFPSTAGLRAGP